AVAEVAVERAGEQGGGLVVAQAAAGELRGDLQVAAAAQSGRLQLGEGGEDVDRLAPRLGRAVQLGQPGQDGAVVGREGGCVGVRLVAAGRVGEAAGVEGGLLRQQAEAPLPLAGGGGGGQDLVGRLVVAAGAQDRAGAGQRLVVRRHAAERGAKQLHRGGAIAARLGGAGQRDQGVGQALVARAGSLLGGERRGQVLVGLVVAAEGAGGGGGGAQRLDPVRRLGQRRAEVVEGALVLAELEGGLAGAVGELSDGVLVAAVGRAAHQHLDERLELGVAAALPVALGQRRGRV